MIHSRQGQYTAGRRNTILEILNKDGLADVSTLSISLGVSSMTIRNDLAQLEKKGALIRTHGGALKIDWENKAEGHSLVSDPQKQAMREKISIGKKAAALVNEGDTIIIDSGFAAYELAGNLGHLKDLTVISNTLNVPTLLAGFPDINIIVPGGTFHPKTASLTGAHAVRQLRKYYCDKLFLDVEGFDVDAGISKSNPEEAYLSQLMISISKETIVITDSGKFQKRQLAFITHASKVSTVVTDKNITSDSRIKLERLGIRVLIAD